MRFKRIDSERGRLSDELLNSQSAAAAAEAALRDRVDSAQGEVSQATRPARAMAGATARAEPRRELSHGAS
eukprot:4798078-Prymnesium_polylepis.1